MKVSHKRAEESMLQITAVVSASEVNEALHAAQVSFARQMNLKPDANKTIAQVAEEQMGITDLDSIVEPQAKDYLIPFALDKKDTVPAYPPQTISQSSFKRNTEYTFVIEVEPKPEYELESYDPVSFSLAPLVIDEKEVDSQLAHMAENYAEYCPDDPHPVEKGNSVLLAIEAFENGKRMEGLSTEGRTYTTGLGYMPDGFDENIIGMEVGETKEFSFVGPSLDEEGREVQQQVTCTVTVKEIQKKVTPTINDAWVAKNMPMFENAEKLKRTIRSQISSAYEREYENYKRQLAVSELAKRFKGKISDPIYEATRQSLLDNLKGQLKQQQSTLEQYIEQNGGEQQFGMMLMMQTRQNLIEGFSLDALFRHEKMTLTEEDIKRACETINPQQPAMVRDQMEKTGYGFALRESASRLKANIWLVNNAQITETKEEALQENSAD